MTISTALIGTRKGLFEYDLAADEPTVKSTHFLGSPVTSVVHDPRDGAWYAGLDHGHFGVKLHRSDDQGQTWTELAYPAYPADAGSEAEPATTRLIWTIEPGHSEPARRAVVRHHSGWAVPQRRPWQDVGSQPFVVGQPCSPRVVRRRLRPAWGPFDLHRSSLGRTR